ncbi:MAG: alkaline shock response membrane anchor protein AmaP, partial [Clostridiaceae bacterium]|nr:alkaline shock response membrane anchor protein AmaP [Clostridiaceae bacterium]
LVFFALSIMFLLSGVRSNKDKKAVGKQTEIGEILISLNSIENIAINASRKTNGVRDSKTMVRKTDNGVEIESRLVVMPEMSIPAITEEVQQRVKKSVEDTAGVRVESVKVIVDNIYSGITYKPRVE